MAGRIPREFIDQLLQRVDIVDIVNGQVPLKKAGKDYQACCPFHDEKTPSFTVSQDKQFYHCFGCGAHGSAVGFVMEYERISFPEAVEELARHAGMEVPREFSAQSPEQDLKPLLEIQLRAKEFYCAQLKQHPQRQRAVDYLKQRGLSGEIAKEYGIGYAPPGWDNLLKALQAPPQLLLQAGLISEPEPGKQYDRLRDRVIFPIHDPRGRVIGFGGRILPGDANDSAPKYLNSPETPVFHKGRHLYGLYEMRKALRRPEQLLVVEGYMDVVALAQQGIRYSVATLGTATTSEHLELLFRQTLRLAFCFDGDRAGREAGWKALQIALPHLTEGREIRFLFLPDGEDPDSLVRKEGQQAFESRIGQALPLSDYLFDHLTEQASLDSTDGRARYAALARPFIEQLPEGLFKQMLWSRLAKLVDAPEEQLNPNSNKRRYQRSRPAVRKPAHQKRMTPVRQAVKLLLKRPELALLDDLPANWPEADIDGIELLRDIVNLIREQPDISPAQLLEHWRDDRYFQPLLTLSSSPSDIDETAFEAEFTGCLARLDKIALEQEFGHLTRQSARHPLSSDEMERLKTLTKLISK